MPRARKNSVQPEQVRKSEKEPGKLEPLHPNPNLLGKSCNDLAKFPDENPYPVLRIHKNGTVLYANRAGEQILKARGSRIGKSAPKEWLRLVEESFTTRRVTRQEVKDDGRIFSLVAVPIPKSNYVNFYGVDITEQKMVERTLQESEKKYRLVNENIPGVVYSALPDEYSTNIFLSGQVEGLTGYTADEFFQKPQLYNEILHPKDKNYVWKKIEEHRRDKKVLDVDYRIITKNGNLKWVRDKATPTLDNEGQIIRIDGFMEDITERKRLEEILEKERQELNLIIDSSPIIVFYKDKEGKLVRVNKAFAEALNIPKEKFLGKTVFDFYSAPIAQAMANDDQEVFRTGRPKLNIIEQYESAKGLRWVRTDKIPIFNKNGDLAGLVGFAQDITEGKLAEEALRESEGRFRSLFEQSPDAIIVVDFTTEKIVEFNNRACEMLGYSREEFEKLSLSEIEVMESKDEITAHKQIVLRRGGDVFETKQRKKDGSLCDVLVNLKPVTIAGKQYVQGIWRNITEQRIAQKRLLEYQKNLKRLAARLTLTEERERRRIARNLHDQVSQSLALAKIKLDTMLASQNASPLAKTLKETNDTIEKAIQNTRALTFDLSYPLLYELGFEAAVSEWLMEHVQKKHDIKTEFFDDGLTKPLDDDVRVLLFRNVRELLINIIKHARADKIKVSVTKTDDSIKIQVEDNGVGLNVDEITASHKSGFGLFSIRESIGELGGNFEIDSKPGAGCKVTMTSPLKGKRQTKE